MKPHLTPLEAKVVNSVMARRDFTHETALKEVADEAAVSEAMVIKIAKKLGFSGYQDFQQSGGLCEGVGPGNAGGTLARRQPARSSTRSSAPPNKRSRRRWRSRILKPTIAPQISSLERDNAIFMGWAVQPRSPATSPINSFA